MDSIKGKHVLVVIALAVLLHRWIGRPTEVTDIVQISQGQIQGIIEKSRFGRNFYSFRGIPYATPPLKSLRFEPPQEALSWEGVLDASNFRDSCLQPTAYETPGGSEDCLYLNVYTPELPIGRNVSLPVMVFFHGGIYTFGSGSEYGAEYLMDEEVVLVTVNYRLLSFGFLSTGDGTVQGNMGLKDQSMSLRWVQKNILHFGGDPDKVTIFGQSAGAASAHLHVVSPMSKGLFHRVISQSGTALTPWTIRSNPGQQAKHFANSLGCPTDNVQAMVSCLKEMDADKIMTVHMEVIEPMRDMIKVFVPTIETAPTTAEKFMPDHPRTLLQNGNFSKVPHILGHNAEDGIIALREVFQDENLRELFHTDLPRFMPDMLVASPDAHVASEISNRYLLEKFSPDKPESLKSIANLFTARWFANSIQEAAMLLKKHDTPVYLYVYSHRQDIRIGNLYLEIRRGLKGAWDLLTYFSLKYLHKITGGDLPYYGVCHIDELVMLFGLPLVPYITKGHPDYDISLNIVKTWADFAKGNPLDFAGIPWTSDEAQDYRDLTFLNISSTPTILRNPHSSCFEFWNSLNLPSNL